MASNSAGRFFCCANLERAQLFGETTKIIHLHQQPLDPDLPQMGFNNTPELFGALRLQIGLVLR